MPKPKTNSMRGNKVI